MVLGAFTSLRTSFAGLLVLLTLVLNVAAQTLGLALDKTASDDASLVRYSAKLTFEQDAGVLFDDEQLYGLAKRAYEEMQTKFPADGVHVEAQPVMMAAMAVGNDVYLSSDLKGGPFLYTYTDTRLKPSVVLALERCQTSLQQNPDLPAGQQYRTRASCAEVFARQQYYLDPDVSVEARQAPPPTRIVAYGRPSGQRGPVGPMSACGGGETMRNGVLTWGCKQFMADEGITVPAPPKPAQVSLPDPFPPFTGKQISIICPGRQSK
ncbi:hypothetical protein LZ30DRAFT_464674 [Colletotrichum cereale]|nr:hypothetical protein LZ30DRAFT_464674 [Colletotrichum cereale]